MLSQKIKTRKTPGGRRKLDFQKVIEYFEESDEEQLAIMDLTNKMAEILVDSDCEPYTAWYLKKKIIERFRDDVVIAEIDGRPDCRNRWKNNDTNSD